MNSKRNLTGTCSCCGARGAVAEIPDTAPDTEPCALDECCGACCVGPDDVSLCADCLSGALKEIAA